MRPMLTWRRVLVLLLVVATTTAAYALPPLQVQRRNNLSFGQILPGTPNTVLWNDAARAGRYQVRGNRNSEILVDFFLPGQLDGRQGSSIPVAFGPGDAVYVPDGNLGSAMPFDPRVPTTLRLPASGRGTILLGGTALPPAQSRMGQYRARVALTVSYTGN